MLRTAVPLLVVLLLVSCATAPMVTPLHEAVRDGDVGRARQEVHRGANLDAIDEEGRTPLHYAASNCYVRIVSALLAAGADPAAQNAAGRTPLEVAREIGCTDAEDLLTPSGAE